MPSKKDLGRLLHDRLASAFYEFAQEHGVMDADVVVGAFLSGAVQAISLVECVEARKVMVHQCISHLIERANVPIVAIVGDCPMQAANEMLRVATPQGTA